MALRIDTETCRNLESALTREWLVTNGLGGYASGTVAGVNTRRYHGLLVAAMNPPVQRMVLLAALEEWLQTSERDPVPLAAQEYWDGTVYPEGFAHLDGVELDGMLPVFRWTADGRTIEKRIWMEHETNRSVISYRLVCGPSVTLQLRPIFAHRDYHVQRHGQGGFDMAETSDGWIIDAEGVRSYLEVRPMPLIRSHPDWYWRVLHRAAHGSLGKEVNVCVCSLPIEIETRPCKTPGQRIECRTLTIEQWVVDAGAHDDGEQETADPGRKVTRHDELP